MLVWDTSTKKFVEITHDFIPCDHLVIFASAEEAKNYKVITDLDRDWKFCIMQKQELSYGNIMLCSWESSQMQMYFRCDGLSKEEVVIKFLERMKLQKQLKDSK